MEDSTIIDLYFARNEQAITETDQKYGRYCFTLANAILNSQQDSEETVNDTYWKTWDSIPPKRPVVFKLFLAKITRNLAFTRWREASAQKRGGGQMEAVLEELEGCIPATGSVEDGLNLQDLTAAIQRFLDTRDEQSRNVFLRRYFFVESTAEIAARYHMKPDTVLRNLSRTRSKLKNYLRKEGYGL